MRWNNENKQRRPGTHRFVTKFLFLPLEIRGEKRWLEKATWFEEWTQGKFGSFWSKIFWSGSPPLVGDHDDYYLHTCDYLTKMKVIRDMVNHIEWERKNDSSRMD